jgi:hypothetical protein
MTKTSTSTIDEFMGAIYHTHSQIQEWKKAKRIAIGSETLLETGGTNKEGLPLGIGSPKGRVPLIQPRRSRIVGSSILPPSLEVGGSDPYRPVIGSLPPHLPDDADRAGTRLTLYSMQVKCPNFGRLPRPSSAQFQGLKLRATRLNLS